MNIKELVSQADEIRQQRQQLHAQDKMLKERLDSLDAEIKSFIEESGTNYDDLSEEDFQALLSKLSDVDQISVEVVYASRDEQYINEIQVPVGASLEDAIVLSGILDSCPGIDLTNNKVGIFGVIKPLSESVNDGDRIEIYRAVTAS
jgi:putative ubiquitin-RnfH superfamily antitoxin RatB of RatAB toxin-antitoxin module